MSEGRYGGLGKVEENTASNESETSTVMYRKVHGLRWKDTTLLDWPENDYRLFVGNLGREVSDESLRNVFGKYASFQKAKVIKNVHTGKSKEYGFVSFSEPGDLINALHEMNGKYIGSRPCKLSRSKWRDRIDAESAKRDKKPKSAGKANGKGGH